MKVYFYKIPGVIRGYCAAKQQGAGYVFKFFSTFLQDEATPEIAGGNESEALERFLSTVYDVPTAKITITEVDF